MVGQALHSTRLRHGQSAEPEFGIAVAPRLAGVLEPVPSREPVRVPAKLLRAVVMRDELSVQSCSYAIQVVITLPHCVILKYESLEVAHRNGDASYLDELYRLKGELLLMQVTDRGVSRAAAAGMAAFGAEPPAFAQAEGCFDQSIRVAQQQKAKSFELRAVISLARLYQNQDKQEEARILLTQIYDRFTEGFDTVDLREAKVLLDELS